MVPLLAALLLLLPRLQAGELSLTQSQIGTLEDSAVEWTFAPGDIESTVVVEAVGGSLDPMLELLDDTGQVLLSSDDYAPAFSPDARLIIPPGGPYTLRVSAAHGEGDYRITALPGSVQRQWADDFSTGQVAPYWTMPGATAITDGLRLESSIGETRYFSPQNAAQSADIYVQASLRWDTSRNDSEAGLVVRGRLEPSRQVTGLRFSVTPGGVYSLFTNDLNGTETPLLQGNLTIPATGIRLGLLIQGTRAAIFADGVLLGQVDGIAFEQQTGWGAAVFNGAVILSDFWMATPARDPLTYPAQITNWASLNPEDITTELINAGVLSAGGSRQFSVPYNVYTVASLEQRNFLITAPEQTYENLVIGGVIGVTQGTDVGCGLVASFQDRGNKVLAFTDTQSGAGLVWWLGNETRVNNYTLIPPTEGGHSLLLIVQDQYVTFYVDGTLTAQNIVPRRAGNVGVGFMNYADRSATCEFRDVWVWR
jgi:hypothetical protein